MTKPTTTIATFFAAALLLAGCGAGTPLMTTAVDAPAAVTAPADATPVAAVEPQAKAPTTTTQVEALGTVSNGVEATPLQLRGMVQLPKGVTGLANARDGIVSGTPVQVLDAATGRRIGSGVTYYDGSYQATVDARYGKRAVVVQVMLVDAATGKDLYPLETTVELAPELTVQQDGDITPATTAWTALLVQMAALKADQAAPDWATITPGQTAITLSQMIAGSHADARDGFLLFAKANGSLEAASSASGLKAAINGMVDHLVATRRSTGS